MNRPLIVAAHGFRTGASTIPTHIRVDDFRRWFDQCEQRTGGFGSPSSVDRNEFEGIEKGPRSTPGIDPPILTFDDALGSIELIADFVRSPAILFVIPDHVGKRNDWPGQPHWVPRESCLNWSDILELAARGWRIGAHTMTHPRLSRISRQRLRFEIEHSRKTIEDKLGTSCDLFAYPYGNAPYSARRIVKEAGITGFGMGVGRSDHRSERACLPRTDLYDLVRPGIASEWAWSDQGVLESIAFRFKRSIGAIVPRRRHAG